MPSADCKITGIERGAFVSADDPGAPELIKTAAARAAGSSPYAKRFDAFRFLQKRIVQIRAGRRLNEAAVFLCLPARRVKMKRRSYLFR